ncbi:response regulator [Persicimonas caeni]|uniref:Response regulator n=1 Tax=Persicimonas caeni TaxID=2292766 RepID=A0A4Y6PNN6_PERCE|nr:response regulator [Persicimonas caeni]QDG49813.1 response regulator [Persicimonas caeni]QED31034.1 response regulator [Persicimonas caeni]
MKDPVDAAEGTDEIAPTMLLVDDDDIFRRRLSRSMERRGFEVSAAADYDEAINLAMAQPPEMAVVDLRLPRKNGLELVRDLLEIEPTIRVVMLTGYGSIDTAVDATRLGAVNFIQKPADADDILAAFDRGEKPPLSESDIDYDAPSLARVEWEHINRVLADCGGNISEAARRLGIHRRTLQRKLNAKPPSE